MPKTANHAASANRAVRPLNADEKLAVAMLVNRGRPAAQIARQLGISAAKAELWAKKYRNAEAEGRLVFFEDDEGAVRPEADGDLDPPVLMTSAEEKAWLEYRVRRAEAELTLLKKYDEYLDEQADPAV